MTLPDDSHVEFVCSGESESCHRSGRGDNATPYLVSGQVNASGEFVPAVDGSEADCPECGHRGVPNDENVRTAER